MSATQETQAPKLDKGISVRARIALLATITLAVVVIWVSNDLLTQRYTETTRNRAGLRVALYAGNLVSELQRNSVVPLLLSRDPALINALNSLDFSQSSQRLISYREEIGAASLLLLDADGRAVAATDREKIGENHRADPYFLDAMRSSDTVFTIVRTEVGTSEFSYARRIETQSGPAGVIVVEVDLAKFEQSWAGISDAVLVTDSEGTIILATEPRWRGQTEDEALAGMPAPSAIQRALRFTADWAALPSEALMMGDSLLRQDVRVAFRGWHIVNYTAYSSVRARVNAVLALEIMGFAILLALGFYVIGRRATLRSAFFQRETADLRRLNDALQREMAERQKAEANLQVAEQTLEQSSKLAALGEMSAAVSHELNQPLAAMKTYLAGARLLLQRRRPEEALSSFQRIDDLIERMGAITRQLKSYARKGGDAFEPIDVRRSISSALSMMEPQLKRRHVRITRNIPREPVMINGDPVRLEQVLINLLRNALDATKSVARPQVDILLAAGEMARVTVRDNGSGVVDLDALFEPFYTTKAPGDGVGLGLAISSGIVSDFGGRLTARNGQTGGAVFELELPLLQQTGETSEAAE